MCRVTANQLDSTTRDMRNVVQYFPLQNITYIYFQPRTKKSVVLPEVRKQLRGKQKPVEKSDHEKDVHPSGATDTQVVCCLFDSLQKN